MCAFFKKTEPTMNVCASKRLRSKANVASSSKRASLKTHGSLPTSHDIRRYSASESIASYQHTLYTIPKVRCSHRMLVPAEKLYDSSDVLPSFKRRLVRDHGSFSRSPNTYKYAALADYSFLSSLVPKVLPKHMGSLEMSVPLQWNNEMLHVLRSSKPFGEVYRELLLCITVDIKPLLQYSSSCLNTHFVFLQKS